MANVLKVNWSKLKEMGTKTEELGKEIEEARTNFQNIINSLNECWEGTDATAFVTNCNNFLNELKQDTLYFEALGQYFTKGSDSYSKTVKETSEKIKRMNQMLEEEKDDLNLIVNPEMVGVTNGNY